MKENEVAAFSLVHGRGAFIYSFTHTHSLSHTHTHTLAYKDGIGHTQETQSSAARVDQLSDSGGKVT